MKSSSRSLDILLIRFFKEIFHSVSPFVLAIVNSSLFMVKCLVILNPPFLKTPLKKPSLDHFRPISKLPFLAKELK